MGATAGLDAVWCSSLGRARATAAAAGLATGLEPHVDERLRELDFGRGEGLTTAEMAKEFPAELRAFQSNPVANHLPDGEDPYDAVGRAVAALDDITRGHPRVLVIAHTTLIRLTLCHLLAMPLADYRRIFPFVRNAAITEIGLDGDQASLLQFNAPLEHGAASLVKESGEVAQRASAP